jgi:hypothetical protein
MPASTFLPGKCQRGLDVYSLSSCRWHLLFMLGRWHLLFMLVLPFRLASMGSTMAIAPTPGASRAAPTPTPRRGTPRGKMDGVQGHGTARPACTHRCGMTWAPSHAKGAPCWVCGGVGSGLSPRVLPLHRVRAKRCGHLVLLRTKSRPRPRCGSPVPDMPRNKRGYLQAFPTRAPAALQGAAKKGVYVACVLVFVMHSCLCLCRLLQRDQHDHPCLFVFVMLARSCLCRLLQQPCRTEEDIERGMAGAAAAFKRACPSRP